ncbi:CrfX protein [Stutzerimonas sp. NM35]|uniref:CrfX protein n=1 Tax=Stutzerimonas stutzeri TaxID=316 RepID=UPI0015E31417|nr:CrfX protein [Stutzerimonas stutzeri]MBA1262147.1 CrfX protein [Stutzerimonas stutzeri]
MGDPFEESLRDMLKAQSGHDDDACLDRVLKTANRQVGAGDLFGLMGHWLQTLLVVLSSGASRSSAVTPRHTTHPTSFDKAD